MRCPAVQCKRFFGLIATLAILAACGSPEPRQETVAGAAGVASPAEETGGAATEKAGGKSAETATDAATDAASDATSATKNGLLYGPGFSFWAKAPDGWVLDSKSGAEQGLAAVFYPVGSSWQDSKAVMYVNTTSKEDDPTLESLLADDLEEMRKNSPDVRATPGEPIALPDGTQVPVNRFTGDQWGNFESVAYIDTPNVWAMFVLTARDEANYKNALPAFVALVKSYQYVTSEVTVEK